MSGGRHPPGCIDRKLQRHDRSVVRKYRQLPFRYRFDRAQGVGPDSVPRTIRGIRRLSCRNGRWADRAVFSRFRQGRLTQFPSRAMWDFQITLLFYNDLARTGSGCIADLEHIDSGGQCNRFSEYIVAGIDVFFKQDNLPSLQRD